MPDGLFGSLKNLNKIRNKHAHALYPEGIIDLENSLILSTPVATKKKKSSFNKKEVHLEKSREEKYAEALKWILGETIDLTSLSPDSHLKA